MSEKGQPEQFTADPNADNASLLPPHMLTGLLPTIPTTDLKKISAVPPDQISEPISLINSFTISEAYDTNSRYSASAESRSTHDQITPFVKGFEALLRNNTVMIPGIASRDDDQRQRRAITALSFTNTIPQVIQPTTESLSAEKLGISRDTEPRLTQSHQIFEDITPEIEKQIRKGLTVEINGHQFTTYTYNADQVHLIPKVLERYLKWGVEHFEQELTYLPGTEVTLCVDRVTNKVIGTIAMTGFDHHTQDKKIEGLDIMKNASSTNNAPIDTLAQELDTPLTQDNIIEWTRLAINYELPDGIKMPEVFRILMMEASERINQENIIRSDQSIAPITASFCQLQPELHRTLRQSVFSTLKLVQNANYNKDHPITILLRKEYPLYFLKRSSLCEFLDKDHKYELKLLKLLYKINELQSHENAFAELIKYAELLDDTSWKETIQKIIVTNTQGNNDPLVSTTHRLLKLIVSQLPVEQLNQLPMGPSYYAFTLEQTQRDLSRLPSNFAIIH